MSRVRSALFLLRDLARRAGREVRRSPGLALSSLVIGVILWVLVTDEENPTRIDFLPTSIPVEAANLDPTLAVANTLPSLQVRLAAPNDRWDELTAEHFRAFVDLNGLAATEQSVPVRIEVVGISQVRVLEASPSTVTVNLEALTTKTVRVTANVVGTLPRGYNLAGLTPDRATAEVVGPASLVALVQQVSANINVTGLTTGLDQTVTLAPLAEGGGEIRGVTVRPASTRVAVAVRQETLTRTLPLEVDLGGQPAPGYRITGVRVTPTSVRVEGSIEVLQGLDTLRLPRVDVGGQQADLRTTVRLSTPEGMVASAASAVVEVTIAPITGSLALTLAPEVTGLRAGFAARVSPGTVTVVVEGPLTRLNAISAQTMRATVDAAPLNAVGTTEIRVIVSGADGVTIREVQPAVVGVTLTRP